MRTINRAQQRTQTSQPQTSAMVDNWLHAVALVMLRRQMRDRWSTPTGCDYSLAI